MIFTIDVNKFYSNFQGVVLQAYDSLGPQSWQQSFIERLVGGELHGEVSLLCPRQSGKIQVEIIWNSNAWIRMNDTKDTKIPVLL